MSTPWVRVKQNVRWMPDFTLLGAQIKYLLWALSTKLVLGFIYLAIMAEGLRILIPSLTQKLYKLPGLTSLRRYELFHRLDLAIPFSLFLMLVVFAMWPKIIRIWLGEDLDSADWDPDRYRWLIMGQGIVLLVIEPLIFYLGATQMSWGGGGFNLPALLATAGYLVVLIFVSYKSVEFATAISTIRKENRS